MVFAPNPTTTTDSTATSTSTTAGEGVDVLEALERVSTMLDPFVQLLTVVVQALTAYTLLRKV